VQSAVEPSQFHPAVTRTGQDHVHCVKCGYALALREGDEGSTVFMNPEGVGCNIGRFAKAAGTHVSGPAFSEGSWFEGWKWRVAECAGCQAHIGWRYERLRETPFWGLIWDCVREEPGTANLAEFTLPATVTASSIRLMPQPPGKSRVRAMMEDAAAFREVAEAVASKKKMQDRAARRKHKKEEFMRKAEEETMRKNKSNKHVQKKVVVKMDGSDQIGKCSAEALLALAADIKPSQPDQQRGEGQIWVVVGGKESGGIIVRKAESISSSQLAFRLATGSQVEELELKGNRMHYKRIRGDGPDWGWVSTVSNGKALAQRLSTMASGVTGQSPR